MIGVALTGLAAVLVAATALWIVSLALEDASIADPFWAPGFLLAGLAYAGAGAGTGGRGAVVLVLLAVWALRLGGHLLRRNLREGEDRRYRAMRRAHGDRFRWVSLVTVFWLQALLLWIISAPVLAAVLSRAPWSVLDGIGLALAGAGIVVEAVADRQLRRFRDRPDSEGAVFDEGLWRYSRHPNYFGDAVLWWGLFLVAASTGAWWTVVSPILLTLLLLRVSGVTLLESDIDERRPAYADYVRRTSAFVPWPPGEPRDRGGPS